MDRIKMTKEEKTPELNVDLPSILEPVFSNAIQISHKDDEFTLTFIHIIPNTNRGKVKAIVALTPQHTKRLLRALDENIKKYESTFGEIRLIEETKAHDSRMYR